MGYSYHIPTRRNPFNEDVLEWRESEVEDLIENRSNMKILIATQKPFAAKAKLCSIASKLFIHIEKVHNYI